MHDCAVSDLFFMGNLTVMRCRTLDFMECFLDASSHYASLRRNINSICKLTENIRNDGHYQYTDIYRDRRRSCNFVGQYPHIVRASIDMVFHPKLYMRTVKTAT